MFANRDLKYEASKIRAKQYARHAEKTVTSVCAKDTPTQEALRERLDPPAQKLHCLQRHDRECVNLHGALQLIEGTEVQISNC